MTLSKITLAVLALGFSFGPAFAESGESNPRLIAPVAAAMSASITEGRQAAMITSGLTDAERFIVDRNATDSHSH